MSAVMGTANVMQRGHRNELSSVALVQRSVFLQRGARGASSTAGDATASQHVLEVSTTGKHAVGGARPVSVPSGIRRNAVSTSIN